MRCLHCESTLEFPDKRKHILKNKKFCSRRCKELTRHKRNTANTEIRKEKDKIRKYTYYHYREQLGDKCSICNSKQNLEIHHEDYIRFTIDNCKLVCRKCHRETIHKF